MDLDRTPAEISRAMAEEVRALNHRTLEPDAFSNAPAVSDTVNGILAVIQRLPQALQQLEAGLQALYENEQIRLADRPPAEVSQADILNAVSTSQFGLKEAGAALGRVEEHLRSATRVLSNLGGPWPSDEGDGEA